MNNENNTNINKEVIAEHFKEIMEKGLKLDIKDPNLIDTPERVAKSYKEIFSGLENSDEKIKKIFSKCFPTHYKGIVFEKDITVFSMCPHHFLPVRYSIAVGYIPNECGIGLSKLVRIIEILAKRPALQETLTEEIVDLIDKNMHTSGAICMVKGIHYCMHMRGIKQKDVITATSSAKGVFLNKPEMELKFYNLVENN